MTRIALTLIGFCFASAATAQRCPPPPGDTTDAPWPDAVEVPSVEVGGPTLQLTRAEGEAIRCATQRRLRRTIPEVPSDLRERVRDRRVGWLWMDGDRPRIGSFWLQSDGDGTLELSDTLHMSATVRIGLVIRFEKRGGRWRLSSVDTRIGHHRRSGPSAATP